MSLCWSTVKLSARVAHEIERQPDRQVRFHRRVHRHERALRRFVQRQARRDDAVEDRLTVLRFAELEIRRLGRRLDEVADVVDVEEARLLAANLPADDETQVELEAEVLHRRRVARVYAAHGFADDGRGVEHRLGVPQREACCVGLKRRAQRRQHCLRQRKVAGGLHDDDALAGPLEPVRLAKRAHLVDAGIGPRVGQKHDAGVEPNPYAVRHGVMVPLPAAASRDRLGSIVDRADASRRYSALKQYAQILLPSRSRR